MTIQRLLDAGLRWIPLAIAITGLAGLVYLVAQQTIRLSANQMPARLAADAATMLAGGARAEAILPPGPVDLGESESPYLIVYDDAGEVVAASARLDGQVPAVPAGVLAAAKQSGENRVTWQPRAGVRSATVSLPYRGAHPGVVLAGQSLAESERLIDLIGSLVALGWAATLLATLLAALVVGLLRSGSG